MLNLYREICLHPIFADLIHVHNIFTVSVRLGPYNMKCNVVNLLKKYVIFINPLTLLKRLHHVGHKWSWTAAQEFWNTFKVPVQHFEILCHIPVKMGKKFQNLQKQLVTCFLLEVVRKHKYLNIESGINFSTMMRVTSDSLFLRTPDKYILLKTRFFPSRGLLVGH